MKSRIITPKAGFVNDDGLITERICFPMRSISLLENTEFWARFAEIADTLSKEERARTDFDILVDGLASWTVEMPFVRTFSKVDPTKYTDTLIEADSPSAAVREYFKEFNVETEKIINAVINAYTNRNSADVVF
jgi:hypothetical protein